jgi:hypothetical protein
MGCVSDQVVMWYYFAFTGRILSYLVQLTLPIRSSSSVSFFVLCFWQNVGILFHIRIMFVESYSIQWKVAITEYTIKKTTNVRMIKPGVLYQSFCDHSGNFV